MESTRPLRVLSDDELLLRLAELAAQSRRVEADLILHIAEVDERRLYARQASPSMFAYCTDVLHLSEAEAYLRIAAARASREHPMLLAMLADGRLHVSAIERLAPHLTRENREDLLKRAVHKSKRQIEELIAELAPRPDAPASIRKLPGRRVAVEPTGTSQVLPAPVDSQPNEPGLKPPLELRPDGVGFDRSGGNKQPELRPDGAAPPSPAGRAIVEPLAPARYKVQFTASAELRDKLERLKDLMRSSVPDGDLAAIIDEAVTEKLQRLEARRFARTNAPRKTRVEPEAPASRHIPAAVRRAVRERDSDRCRYVDAQGRRCTARERLEFHHRHPFGYGGGHSPQNICLMCRTHNTLMAEADYGRRVAGKQHPRPVPRPG